MTAGAPVAEVGTETQAARAEFAALLAAQGVPLPVTLSPGEIGAIQDADGRDLCTVDVNGERPDDQVQAIARLIAVTINACGGFKSEATSDV